MNQYNEILYSIIDVLERHDKLLTVLFVCVVVIILVIAIICKKLEQALEVIEKHNRDTLQLCYDTLGIVKQDEKEMLQLIDEVLKVLKTLEEYESAKQIERYMNALENFRNHVKEEIEKKERFHKLSNEPSLEEFKKEAEEYFEERIQETYDEIDSAWGMTSR